jgi:CAAX protease family protein
MIDAADFGPRIALGELRVLRPGKLRWLRAVAWMVALVFAIALAAGPTTELLQHLLPHDVRFEFLSRCVGAVVVLGAYVLLVRLGEVRLPTELSPKHAPLGLVLGLLIGFLMFSTVMAIMLGFGLYHVEFVGLAPAWESAGLAIQSGVFEEVIIRGVVMRLMWRAFGPLAAFVISAALFGAGHIGNAGATAFSTICVAIEAGVMLGAFYALTGRLWMSIGVHSAWNFTQGYLFGAAVSGSDFPPCQCRERHLPGAI